MKTYIKGFILIFICISVQLHAQPVTYMSNSELLTKLKEINWLEEENEFEIDGELENGNILIKYHSVSADEYFDSFKAQKKRYSFFNKKYQINEPLGDGAFRVDQQTLVVPTGQRETTFINSADNVDIFFYGGQVANYKVVYSYEFEDIHTYFLDETRLRGDFILWGLGAQFNSDNNLITYSNHLPFFYGSESEFSIFKAKHGGVDTLLTTITDWIASNMFFANDSTMYYSHSIKKQNRVASTYAKMTLFCKEEDSPVR